MPSSFCKTLQTLTKTPTNQLDVVSRSDESVSPANPTFFGDDVATKDIHIDPLTSLSLRIFLPNSVVSDFKHVNNDGYSPDLTTDLRKLSVVLQFHGGGFVTGSGVSVANDLFCRRIAKACDSIVAAVRYKLALESKFSVVFDTKSVPTVIDNLITTTFNRH